MGEALARTENWQGKVREVTKFPNPLLSKRSKAILEPTGTASEAYCSVRSATTCYLLADNSSALTIAGWSSEKITSVTMGSTDPIIEYLASSSTFPGANQKKG